MHAKSDLADKERSWRHPLVSARRASKGCIVRTALVAFAAFGTCASGTGIAAQATAATSSNAPPVAGADARLRIDKDGTVHLLPMAVPVSEYLSPEAKAWVAERLRISQSPELLKGENGNPVFLQKYIDRMHQLYPVKRKDTRIGGVHVYDYTPVGGVSERNRNRVLLELHPGAFRGCWPSCAELQSIPIASVGRIRVLAVDFRMAPKYKFPAASEDIAAVYKELLKTYPAENIGIFGCSAGGQLAGQAVAWFQKHDLPRPGAIGIYCAGAALSPRVLSFGGDGEYIGRPLGEGAMPRKGPRRDGYLSNVDPKDPLVAPAVSDEVLSRFPPTQVITGTRSFDLSSAVYTHSRLVKLGVEADLHVWEGLFHFFFLNPDVPESRDAYDVIVKFFDKHLGH